LHASETVKYFFKARFRLLPAYKHLIHWKFLVLIKIWTSFAYSKVFKQRQHQSTALPSESTPTMLMPGWCLSWLCCVGAMLRGGLQGFGFWLLGGWVESLIRFCHCCIFVLVYFCCCSLFAACFSIKLYGTLSKTINHPRVSIR